MSFKGKANRYTCRHDEKHVVTTRDLDDGVTPFLIPCETCKAAGVPGERGWLHPVMESHCYRVPQHYPHTHEWYAPDEAERATLAPHVLAHVEKGGLLLRAVTT